MFKVNNKDTFSQTNHGITQIFADFFTLQILKIHFL